MHNIFVSLKMYAFWCANSSKKGPPAVSTCACLHYWCGRLYPSEPSAATTHTASVKTFPQSVHRNTHMHNVLPWLLLKDGDTDKCNDGSGFALQMKCHSPGWYWLDSIDGRLVLICNWCVTCLPCFVMLSLTDACQLLLAGRMRKKKNKKQQHTSCVASISLLHCGIAKSITLLTLLSSVDLFVGSLCITKSFIELFLPLQSTKSFEKKNKKNFHLINWFKD